jgi:hypothetical protein
MATVTFSNGKTATFKGTPTPQDIQYVASQMGISGPVTPGTGPSQVQSTAPAQASQTPSLATLQQAAASASPYTAPVDNSIQGKVLRGGTGLLSKLETPFLSVGAAPTQLIAKSLGQPDPFANGVPAGVPGAPVNAPITPATPEGFLQKVGQAGQIASSAFLPEGAGIKTLSALGGANALSQTIASGDNNLGDITKNTLFGTLTGAGLGILGDFGKFFSNAEKAKIGISGTVQAAKNLTGPIVNGVEEAASPVEQAVSDLGDTADKSPVNAPGDPVTPAQAPQIASNIANEIAHTDPDLLSHYANTTLEHGENFRVPTPVQIAENAMVKRANIFMKQVLPQAGEAVGDAKTAAANLPISIPSDVGNGIVSGTQAAQQIMDNVTQKVEQMTGHTFGTIASQGFDEGSVPVVSQMHGRAVELNSTEEKQLQGVYKALDSLTNYKSTVGQAVDHITNLRKSLMGALTSGAVVTDSPVVGAVKYAIGAINDSVRSASPELAEANTQYANLKNLQEAIAQNAGEDLQNANLMMRRVVAGDKSGHVIPVLDQLNAVTQPFIKAADAAKDPELQGNLVQHAILAKWATDNFGDESTKTLLQGYTSKEKEVGGILTYPRRFLGAAGNHVLGAVSPDAAQYAQSLAKGAPQSMEPVARTIDSWVSSSEGKNLVSAFAKQLAAIGITAKNAEEKIAIPLVKTFIINQLNNPQTGLRAQMGASSNPAGNLPAGVGPLVTPPQQQQPQATSSPISSTAGNGRTLSVAQPTQQAINNVTPASSGQQYSSQARKLSDFGMNLGTNNGLRVT